MNRVLISYRRSDSLDATGRIYDWLRLHFNRTGMFFRDIDDMPLASDFADVLETAIANCTIVIVIIGSRWLEELHRRQTLGRADHLVMEIEIARRLGKTVLPVMLNGTRMPNAEDLPDSLQWLTRIHYHEVHGDSNFPDHMRRLAQTIATATGEPRADYDRLMLSCRTAGLTWYDTTFESYPLADLIAKAQSLTIVLNDGRGWIDSRRRAIENRIAAAGTLTRVVLLHPDSPFLNTLVKKNRKPLATQRYEICRSLETLHQIAEGHSEARLQTRGHFSFNPITAFVSEDVAVVSHYLYSEQGELPCFAYSRVDGGYYHRLKQDVDALFVAATEITPEQIKQYMA